MVTACACISDAPYVARGIALHELGDATGARADLDAAIEIRPEDPTPWYFRALVREAAGDLAGAIEDFEQAIARVDDSWQHHDALRELELRLRRVGKGVAPRIDGG